MVTATALYAFYTPVTAVDRHEVYLLPSAPTRHLASATAPALPLWPTHPAVAHQARGTEPWLPLLPYMLSTLLSLQWIATRFTYVGTKVLQLRSPLPPRNIHTPLHGSAPHLFLPVQAHIQTHVSLQTFVSLQLFICCRSTSAFNLSTLSWIRRLQNDG